jgi:hypothetical protein
VKKLEEAAAISTFLTPIFFTVFLLSTYIIVIPTQESQLIA